MTKIFDFDKIKFLIAFLLCTYTGLRIISNSMIFYGHEESFIMILTEWLYWFSNMPIWWPSHFVIFFFTLIFIYRIFSKNSENR